MAVLIGGTAAPEFRQERKREHYVENSGLELEYTGALKF